MRRENVLCAMAMSTIALISAGCATQPSSATAPAIVMAGVGLSPGGPDLDRYTDNRGDIARADRTNWWGARYSVDSFSRIDEILAARVSARPASPRAWQYAAQPITVTYDGAPVTGSGRYSIDGYLGRNPVTGLLIAQGDTILLERYQYGRTDSQRMTSFSMAKTLIALMIGIALDQGKIKSIDDRAQVYVPSLQGSAYGATPIRHLLTMSSGVKFREDYDGRDDSARLSQATIGGGSGGAGAARLFDERIAEPGARWSYASAETFVLALVLREAIGQPIADYFSQTIWQPIGAEANASWLIDRTGLEVGYMGFNAVVRDYARLAMMLARGGKAGDKQVVPVTWLREMSTAQFSGSQTGRWFGYGYQTWIFPDNDGSFALLGVRGQSIFVDPKRELVMVNTAVRPSARDAGGADTTALWRAVRRGVAPKP
jgi:CubicO group peptidase (beta-lactamase class C family)